MGLFGLLKKNKTENKPTKKWSKDEAEFIFLVGSHTGRTELMAKSLFKGLISKGKKVYMDELDNYSTYQNATHLIIFTSTYGAGGPPANATYFEDSLVEIEPINPLKFSVLAFGSTSFPDFCKFGVDVDSLLNSMSSFERFLPLVKINNQSESDFRGWLSLWNRSSEMNLLLDLKNSQGNFSKVEEFTVIENKQIPNDDTHIIKLRPNNFSEFQSGDLLSVYTEKENNPRMYSVAKIDENILLSVKKHDKGICSSYLCNLKNNDVISATLEKNNSFHFVHDAPSVWMIGNGTGIAPFLGMMEENKSTSIQLIWGGRKESSFDLYKPYAEKAIENGLMKSYDLALSRTEKKQYVQDVLGQKKEEVSAALDSGSVFMICGSMNMQNSVLQTLDEITNSKLDKSISFFLDNGQLLKDCY